MPEFVKHSLSDFGFYVVFRSADCLDRLLIDGDPVRQSEIVMVAALSERHTLIKAKEEPARTHTGALAIASRRAPLNDDVDVLDAP